MQRLIYRLTRIYFRQMVLQLFDGPIQIAVNDNVFLLLTRSFNDKLQHHSRHFDALKYIPES